MQHPAKLLLTEREAADLIGFTPRFLQERRWKGGGPRYIKVGGKSVRYRPDDLNEWAADLVRTSTSDDGSAREAA